MTLNKHKLTFSKQHPHELRSKEDIAHAQSINKRINITVNLRKIPLLAQLNIRELAQVKKELKVKCYARRDVVIKNRSKGESLLFLLSGRLQAMEMTNEGKVIGLHLLTAGDFFGETTLINQARHNTSVIALGDVIVAFLPQKLALYFFSHSPSVAIQIQRRLAQKVQLDYKFRAMLSIRSAAKRLSCFLMLAHKNGSGKQVIVENLPTHQEIAHIINTSRETVTRTLLMLARQGVIRKDARRIFIEKPEVLQKMIKESTH